MVPRWRALILFGLAGSFLSGPSAAAAADVRMFDHPPTEEELSAVFAPLQRSIVMATPKPKAIGFQINFGLNSAAIAADSISYLESVGQFLGKNPNLRLIIEGHTDARGSDEYNLALSKRRAKAVWEYLVNSYKIEPQRLAYVGKGKTEPLTQNPFDPQNRRVQFVQRD